MKTTHTSAKVKKSEKDAANKKAGEEIRTSHIGFGFLGDYEDDARGRIQRADYYSPRIGSNGPVYVTRRGVHQTIPIELADVGLAQNDEPNIGWDYCGERKCFIIKTTNSKLQGEVLVKLFGFKEIAGNFFFGKIKVHLLDSRVPAKWHMALYHHDGVAAKHGFSWLCSKHNTDTNDIFDCISKAFKGVSQKLPKNGIMEFDVPRLPGFKIEVMFGASSLRAHALESVKRSSESDSSYYGTKD